MNFEIKTTICINNIAFGDNRKKVRNAFGKDYTVFKQNKFAENTTDAYSDFHIFYNKHNEFEAIEFYNLNHTFIIDNKPFNGGTIESIKKSFPDIIKIEDDFYVDLKAALGFDFEDTLCSSILIGNSGYYDYLV